MTTSAPAAPAVPSGAAAVAPLDRTQVCPVLLRCFWSLRKHHSVVEYRKVSEDIFPAQEVQMYTWRDASLRELADLLKDAVPPAREAGASLSFNLIFIDRAGCWQFKSVRAGRSGPDDDRTLASVKFEAGDMLDIAIHPAGHDVRDAAQRRLARGSAGGGVGRGSGRAEGGR